MIVYFEDGKLNASRSIIPCDRLYDDDVVIIDAAEGVSHCKRLLNYFSEAVIYTNSPLAFDSKYAWNKELKEPDIYLRNSENRWTHIGSFTDRELREGTNLWKLYLAGEFNKE